MLQHHAEAENLLTSGGWPDILYKDASSSFTAALFCFMHALRTPAYVADEYLPAVTSRTLTGAHAEINTHDIGEVWWLFDAEQPYLAEVFKGGNVPGSRFPHMDKSRIKGNAVARILGSAKRHMKVVSRSAKKRLYSLGCTLETFVVLFSCVIIDL